MEGGAYVLIFSFVAKTGVVIQKFANVFCVFPAAYITSFKHRQQCQYGIAGRCSLGAEESIWPTVQLNIAIDIQKEMSRILRELDFNYSLSLRVILKAEV